MRTDKLMIEKHISRRSFLRNTVCASTSLALTGIGNASDQSNSKSRPNIIIIMADDMGFSDIGCYGGEIDTPNIDRLAKNGLRFTQFYNTARCCPTRASLLTGLYSHQAGIGHMVGDKGYPSYQGYLNTQCITIAEALQLSGYKTLMTGKWHVGNEKGHWPLDRGFNRFYGSNTSTGSYFGINDDNYDRRLLLDNNEIYPPEQWYATDAYTDYAIQFVEEACKEPDPFFLYLAYTAPHWPLHALPEDIAKYKGRYKKGWDHLREERLQRMVEMGIIDEKWGLSPRGGKAWNELDEKQKEEMDLRMAVYAAQIDRMDQNIGKLISALKKRNELDDTLILFLADNGGCAEGGQFGFTRKFGPTGTGQSYASYGLCWANASNTPFRRYKKWVHEGGISTPLVAHWPNGIKSKNEFRNQVGHVIDLMPTCLELAGAEYPSEYDGHKIKLLEGKSLVPAFSDQPIPRDALYWEHEGNRAVRVGKWKLVSKHPDKWELYDLEKDRSELNNLASTYPDKVEELRKMYNQWAKRAEVLPWPVKQ